MASPFAKKESAGGLARAVPFIGVTAIATAPQSITTGAFNVVTFDSETISDTTDRLSMHGVTGDTSRFVIPAAYSGFWTGVASLYWDTNSIGLRLCYWTVNGVQALGSQSLVPATNGNPCQQPVLQPVFLRGGDYLQVWAYQASGTTRTFGETWPNRSVTTAAIWRLGA